MRARLLTVLSLVVFGAAAALALPAFAKDTHAPAAGRDRWLPCEPWVMYHWLPFNERHLFALTGIKRFEFKDWIRDDDHHTLAMLIRKHGKDPDKISEQLMGQWKGKVSAARFNELKRRTDEVMTQGHLSQHVFFHYFHNPELAFNSRAIFHVAPGDYHRARLRGWTPAEIAAVGGVPVRTAERRAMRVMQKSQDYAVAHNDTSRNQASAFLRSQRKWLDVWRKQDIHTNRKASFPRGYAPARGSKLKQACDYMSGSDHPDGSHDGANYKPVRSSAVGGFSLYCCLHAERAERRRH